jgi:hypothetical protein
VDLVSNDEDVMATGAGEVAEEIAIDGEEEEGAIATDGSPEQTAVEPRPPPST